MRGLNDFLSELGLTQEEVTIYLSILKNGPSTVLEIARDTQLKRTNVYRFCEQLGKKGYLLKNAQWRTTRYEAASLDFLETKIKSLEDKADWIKNRYHDLLPSFENLQKTKDRRIEVIHYSGQDEVRQLIWNSLKARTVIKSFAYRTLSEPLGKLFIVRWWNQHVRQNIKSQLIANPGTFEMKDRVDKYTKEKYLKHPTSIWRTRVIDPKILRITQETFIYNDVFAIVQWKPKEIFGVEIYNQQVADQERAVFNVLWKMASKDKKKKS